MCEIKLSYLSGFSTIEREIIILLESNRKNINWCKSISWHALYHRILLIFLKRSLVCIQILVEKHLHWFSKGVTFVTTLVRRLWIWGNMVWHLWLVWCEVCDQVWQCDICDHYRCAGEADGWGCWRSWWALPLPNTDHNPSQFIVMANWLSMLWMLLLAGT